MQIFAELEVNMVDYEKIFATKNYQASLRPAWKIRDRRSVNGFILQDPTNLPFRGTHYAYLSLHLIGSYSIRPDRFHSMYTMDFVTRTSIRSCRVRRSMGNKFPKYRFKNFPNIIGQLSLSFSRRMNSVRLIQFMDTPHPFQ